MEQKEFNVVAGDGTFLTGHYWKPPGYPRAVICLVHGIGEHSGRYDAWSERFCRQNYMVYAIDLRGHGLSEGKRGCINHLSDYMDDIDCMVELVKHDWCDLPHYIYGHSMGGNLVLNYLLKKRQDFNGAIITSPWLKLCHPPSVALQNIALVLGRLFPGLTIKTGIKSSQLTSDIKMQDENDNDKLMHRRISLRLFSELNGAASEVLEKSSGFDIPILLAHGTEDVITRFDVTRDLARNIGQNAAFFPAPGARHELHREPVAEELFISIFSWMKKSLKIIDHAI